MKCYFCALVFVGSALYFVMSFWTGNPIWPNDMNVSEQILIGFMVFAVAAFIDD